MLIKYASLNFSREINVFWEVNHMVWQIFTNIPPKHWKPLPDNVCHVPEDSNLYSHYGGNLKSRLPSVDFQSQKNLSVK